MKVITQQVASYSPEAMVEREEARRRAFAATLRELADIIEAGKGQPCAACRLHALGILRAEVCVEPSDYYGRR